MLWNWSIPWQEWNCLWETRNCPWIPCMIPLSFVIWNMIWFHKHSGHQPKPVTAIIWNQSLYPIRHYFPDIRANPRPGCWKQLPLPVPHCWQYRRRLESIATVCIMIADPSLEVCVPRHLSRLWGRSTAVTAVSSRQNRDAPAETLLGLRQGQLYVAGDSDIRLSRCREKRGNEGFFVPLYMNIALGR